LASARASLRLSKFVPDKFVEPGEIVHTTTLSKNGEGPEALLHFWRRGWDSNPRYGKTVNRISNPAHSTTLPPLRAAVNDTGGASGLATSSIRLLLSSSFRSLEDDDEPDLGPRFPWRAGRQAHHPRDQVPTDDRSGQARERARGAGVAGRDLGCRWGIGNGHLRRAGGTEAHQRSAMGNRG